MNLATRMKIERSVVRFLCRTMKTHKWLPVGVHNGDEYINTPLLKDVMEHVFSVDEAHIIFYNKAIEKKHTVYIVLGNDGYDAICDYGYSETDDFDTVMKQFVDPFTDKLSEKYC